MKNVSTTKYVLHAKLTADGVVERPDVVGAIFGQTEGLLGDELDLRELQSSGRIGRIDINLETKNGKTRGEIEIPSGLGKIETSILGAALETVDRVGPSKAKIEVDKIEDVRTSKRNYIVDRAKEILSDMLEESAKESEEIKEEIEKSIKSDRIVNFGEAAMPAGPHVPSSDSLIIVEGRSDVLNLLKNGVKNAIAIEGTSVPPEIKEITKDRTVTAFTDGDRGGELILKELLQVADVDYIARAPEDKEVEELDKTHIMDGLRKKMPTEEYLKKERLKDEEESEEEKVEEETEEKELEEEEEQVSEEDEKEDKSEESFQEYINKVREEKKAVLLNNDDEKLKEIPVGDLIDEIKSVDSISTVIFDGILTQRLIDVASDKGIKTIIGARKNGLVRRPVDLEIKTFSE